MKLRKGWFNIPGVQAGDRTVQDQMKGLDALELQASGKTVLDLGCAEGLVARQLVQAGAQVHGVEVVRDAVLEARKQCPEGEFYHVDLNVPHALKELQLPPIDVVLALAVLHKLRNPLQVVRTFLSFNPALVVLRMPPATPGFVLDRRSGMKKHDVAGALDPTHALVYTTRGHFDEWVGYFERR